MCSIEYCTAVAQDAYCRSSAELVADVGVVVPLTVFAALVAVLAVDVGAAKLAVSSAARRGAVLAVDAGAAKLGVFAVAVLTKRLCAEPLVGVVFALLAYAAAVPFDDDVVALNVVDAVVVA